MSLNYSQYHTSVTIEPVKSGFVVSYPETDDSGNLVIVREVATTAGKAMRIAKAAVEAFSLVKKDADAE